MIILCTMFYKEDIIGILIPYPYHFVEQKKTNLVHFMFINRDGYYGYTGNIKYFPQQTTNLKY